MIFLWLINLQVYSSLAPIIHIVNVGTAARESYANVTVSSHQDLHFCMRSRLKLVGDTIGFDLDLHMPGFALQMISLWLCKQVKYH